MSALPQALADRYAVDPDGKLDLDALQRLYDRVIALEERGLADSFEGATSSFGGSVDTAGAVLNGRNFTSSKLATGRYRITFPERRGAMPNPVAGCYPNTLQMRYEIAARTTTSFDLHFHRIDTGALTDVDFSFNVEF